MIQPVNAGVMKDQIIGEVVSEPSNGDCLRTYSV